MNSSGDMFLTPLPACQPMQGPVDTVFELNIIDTVEGYAKHDNVNPYHICDGKWGGLGPQSWFRFEGLGNNVYEVEGTYTTEGIPEGFDGRTTYAYRRCWDVSQDCWRDVTVEELGKLPPLESALHRPIKFDKFAFPLFAKGLVAPSL